MNHTEDDHKLGDILTSECRGRQNLSTEVFRVTDAGRSSETTTEPQTLASILYQTRERGELPKPTFSNMPS